MSVAKFTIVRVILQINLFITQIKFSSPVLQMLTYFVILHTLYIQIDLKGQMAGNYCYTPKWTCQNLHGFRLEQIFL